MASLGLNELNQDIAAIPDNVIVDFFKAKKHLNVTWVIFFYFKCKHLNVKTFPLTHCGPVMPYGDIGLRQHLLR